MKKFALAVLIGFVAVAFVALGPTSSFAQQKQKIEKFGEDKRIKEWANKKFETSTKTFNWRMSDPWGGSTSTTSPCILRTAFGPAPAAG